MRPLLFCYRRFNNLAQRLIILELDVEPDGRFSEGFERLAEDIDSLQKQAYRLEHGQNQIKASLSAIFDRLTGWNER